MAEIHRKLGGSPNIYREIAVIGSIDADTSTLDESSLPALLHKMVLNRRPAFEEFESLVTRLVPSVRHVYVHKEDGNSVSVRISNAAAPVIDTAEAYRLDTVGGGVNEIIYLIAAIWLSPPGSVLLVEEPERGLHSTSQRLLLKEAVAHADSAGKQILWATHSTVMAPLEQGFHTFLVNIPDPATGVSIAYPSGSDGLEILTALGHSNADLYSYDTLVLVDGETEAAAMPLLTAHLIEPARARSVGFEDMGGDVRTRKIS